MMNYPTYTSSSPHLPEVEISMRSARGYKPSSKLAPLATTLNVRNIDGHWKRRYCELRDSFLMVYRNGKLVTAVDIEQVGEVVLKDEKTFDEKGNPCFIFSVFLKDDKYFTARTCSLDESLRWVRRLTAIRDKEPQDKYSLQTLTRISSRISSPALVSRCLSGADEGNDYGSMGVTTTLPGRDSENLHPNETSGQESLSPPLGSKRNDEELLALSQHRKVAPGGLLLAVETAGSPVTQLVSTARRSSHLGPTPSKELKTNLTEICSSRTDGRIDSGEGVCVPHSVSKLSYPLGAGSKSLTVPSREGRERETEQNDSWYNMLSQPDHIALARIAQEKYNPIPGQIESLTSGAPNLPDAPMSVWSREFPAIPTGKPAGIPYLSQSPAQLPSTGRSCFNNSSFISPIHESEQSSLCVTGSTDSGRMHRSMPSTPQISSSARSIISSPSKSSSGESSSSTIKSGASLAASEAAEAAAVASSAADAAMAAAQAALDCASLDSSGSSGAVEAAVAAAAAAALAADAAVTAATAAAEASSPNCGQEKQGDAVALECEEGAKKQRTADQRHEHSYSQIAGNDSNSSSNFTITGAASSTQDGLQYHDSSETAALETVCREITLLPGAFSSPGVLHRPIAQTSVRNDGIGLSRSSHRDGTYSAEICTEDKRDKKTLSVWSLVRAAGILLVGALALLGAGALLAALDEEEGNAPVPAALLSSASMSRLSARNSGASTTTSGAPHSFAARNAQGSISVGAAGSGPAFKNPTIPPQLLSPDLPDAVKIAIMHSTQQGYIQPSAFQASEAAVSSAADAHPPSRRTAQADSEEAAAQKEAGARREKAEERRARHRATRERLRKLLGTPFRLIARLFSRLTVLLRRELLRSGLGKTLGKALGKVLESSAESEGSSADSVHDWL